MGKIICWNKSCRPDFFWWFPLRLLRVESGCCFWREKWSWIEHERNKGRKSYRSHRVQKRCVCRQNLWKNGLFRSRYSSVTHSIDRKPREWRLARSAYSIKYGTSCLGRPSGDVLCASEDMAYGLIDFQNGEQQRGSGSDKKRRNRLQ